MKMMFKRKKELLALAVIAATLASGAHAAELSFTAAPFGPGAFDLYGDQYIHSSDETGAMGMWQVSATNPTSSFLAFCIEPFAALPGFPGTSATSASYSSASYSNANVQELYDRYYGDVSSGSAALAKVMGFQLALWNLENGQAINSWTLALSGDAANTEANTMIASVIGTDTVAQKYTLTHWSSTSATNYQDVLQAAPVPEPEAYALMLAGLAMVGTIVRRRKAPVSV